MPVLESLNKHHYQGFFLVTFQPFCHLNKQRHRHSCFPVGFAKFFKTNFLKNTCERLSFVFWDMHRLISSFVLFRPAGQENSCFANVKLFPANLRGEENQCFTKLLAAYLLKMVFTINAPEFLKSEFFQNLCLLTEFWHNKMKWIFCFHLQTCIV